MMCYCCKQEPFNRFTYAIVGDGTATSLFDINENTGDIKVKEGLATDTDLSYVVCRCIYSFLTSCIYCIMKLTVGALH